MTQQYPLLISTSNGCYIQTTSTIVLLIFSEQEERSLYIFSLAYTCFSQVSESFGVIDHQIVQGKYGCAHDTTRLSFCHVAEHTNANQLK